MSPRPSGHPVASTFVCDWGGTTAPAGLLGDRERALAAAFPPWRCEEWTRGRLTAKAALLAVRGLRAEVLTAPDGAPYAYAGGRRPAGVALSIAHTGDTVACAVLPEVGAVGVDVERVDPRNHAVLARVTSPGERFPAVPEPVRATVVLGCKEAAVKALRRPSARLSDYRIGPPVGPRCVAVWLAGSLAGGRPALHVSYRTFGGLVLAVGSRTISSPDVYDVRPDAILTLLASGARPSASRATRPRARRG